MATKDITDLQICQAYEEYEASRPKLPLDEISHRILARIPCSETPQPWPYEILHRTTGQCEKVCYRAMERASDRGLLDYGTSLRTGWLTEKGKALLDAPAFPT